MGKSKDLATGAAYQDQTESDARYANVTGDTFTGLVNITNTYSSDTTEQLRVSDNTGSKLDFFGHANGTKSIQAYADDGSTFYNLNLQPLGGYVTKPNHPSFFAYSTASNLVTNQAQIPADFNATLTNVGGHFNTSSKRFVAPVAGSYYFSVSGQLASASALAHEHALGVFIRKNGATFKDQYGGNYGSGTSAQYMTVVCNAVMSLAANDYVDVEYRPHTTVNIEYSGGTRRCTFSGYLIG